MSLALEQVWPPRHARVVEPGLGFAPDAALEIPEHAAEVLGGAVAVTPDEQDAVAGFGAGRDRDDAPPRVDTDEVCVPCVRPMATARRPPSRMPDTPLSTT